MSICALQNKLRKINVFKTEQNTCIRHLRNLFEYSCSPLVLSGVHVVQSFYFLCSVLQIIVCTFFSFLSLYYLPFFILHLLITLLVSSSISWHFNVHVIYFVNKSLTPYSFRNPSFVCFSLIKLCGSVTLYLVVTLSGRTLPYKFRQYFHHLQIQCCHLIFPVSLTVVMVC